MLFLKNKKFAVTALFFAGVFAVILHAYAHHAPWHSGGGGGGGGGGGPPINITHTTSLNFGKAVKPSSGKNRIVVRRNGSLGGGTTAQMLDTSSLSEGRDTIKSAGGNNTIQISFENCGSNSSLGLELKKFKARYDGVNFTDIGVGLSAPGGGSGTEVKYGATLVVNSSAATGFQEPCYDLIVEYE